MFYSRHSAFRARRLAAYTYSSRPSRSMKERANLSFFIVVMFFGVFGVIVLTELFLVDERGRGQGVQVRHGAGGAPARHRARDTRPDYEDPPLFQPEDYVSYGNGKARWGVRKLGVERVGARGGVGAGVSFGGVLPPQVEQQLPGVNSTNLTAKDGAWQIVSGTRYKFLVFSAFYDKRDGRVIRVIGATKTRGPERVFCRFWYSNSSERSVTVPAKVKVIRENWNLKYSACFVLCPLRVEHAVPETLSVVARLRVRPHNLLTVRNHMPEPDKPQPIPTSLGVCVKPLHFDYNRALEMLEFLELNSLLGAEHFTFYNHTIGPQVSCILRDYASRGQVTLLPWKLNMASQREIRTEGLFAALNDCLYRNMNRHAQVAIIDLDEFIVPRHNGTLLDLLQWLGARPNTKNAGSFSFQNAFFYLQWPDDPEVNSAQLEGRLVTARKTTRRAKLHPHKQRSKYICKPEFVIEAGNHFVWEFLPGHGAFNVHPSAAILHHYRVCEFGGDDCVKSAHTVDRTAHRYKDRLAKRVAQRWAQLNESCALGNPLDTPLPSAAPVAAANGPEAPENVVTALVPPVPVKSHS